MFYRLSCAAVVIFWLVMTTLLVSRSYFSTEDRLPLVRDVDEVTELFLSNPNTSNLNVYRDDKEVGSISITSEVLANGNHRVLMSALGKIDFPGLDEQDIGWRGELELNSEREVVDFEVTVRFRHPSISIRLEIDPKTFEIDYLVEEGGLVLIDSEDEESKEVKRVKFLLSAWGLSPKALKKKEARNESLAGENVMVARHGKVVIGGERQSAYILELAPMRGKRFKLYFAESGELLKVGNVMGYQVLSEGFFGPSEEDSR